MPTKEFQGFSKDAIDFLNELRDNNNKEWFKQRKGIFETLIVEPARQFVVSLGERMKEINPDIVAEPKINRSIFRIYRDTRFTKDKSPYKTHVGILFWDSCGNKMEAPGYYFHFSPDKFMLGAGIHLFPKQVMKAYRDSVMDDNHGAELEEIIEKIKSKGYKIGTTGYKKVPRGYDKNHPRAAFLLHKGLTGFLEGNIPDEFHSREIVTYTFRRFNEMSPIVNWLIKIVKRIK